MPTTAETKIPVKKAQVAKWSDLADREPAYALVSNVDLVAVRYDDEVSVLYGRCLHRGALMSDASIVGEDLICGVHGWDNRYKTGVSAYNNKEVLPRFGAWVDREADAVFVDEMEVPTMAALARARKRLDMHGRGDVTLIITGGLRTESDFVKALALGVCPNIQDSPSATTICCRCQ